MCFLAAPQGVHNISRAHRVEVAGVHPGHTLVWQYRTGEGRGPGKPADCRLQRPGQNHGPLTVQSFFDFLACGYFPEVFSTFPICIKLLISFSAGDFASYFNEKIGVSCSQSINSLTYLSLLPLHFCKSVFNLLCPFKKNYFILLLSLYDTLP